MWLSDFHMSVWGYGVFKTIMESRVCTCQEAVIDSVEALIFVCSHKRLVPWTCLFFSYKIVSLFVLGHRKRLMILGMWSLLPAVLDCHYACLFFFFQLLVLLSGQHTIFKLLVFKVFMTYIWISDHWSVLIPWVFLILYQVKLYIAKSIFLCHKVLLFTVLTK